jgi:hypothetical protein
MGFRNPYLLALLSLLLSACPSKWEPVPNGVYSFDLCGERMMSVYRYSVERETGVKVAWGEVGKGIVRVESFPPTPTDEDQFPWKSEAPPFSIDYYYFARSVSNFPTWVGWSSNCTESYFWGVRRTATGRMIPVLHRFSVTEGTWLPPREVTEASAPILIGPQDTTIYPFYPVGSEELLSLEMDGSEGVYRFWVWEEERWVKSGELRCSYPPPGTDVEDPICREEQTFPKDAWEGVWIPLASLFTVSIVDGKEVPQWNPFDSLKIAYISRGRVSLDISPTTLFVHRILFFHRSEGEGVTTVVSFHPVEHWLFFKEVRDNLTRKRRYESGYYEFWGLFSPVRDKAWFVGRTPEEGVTFFGVPLTEPFPSYLEEVKTYYSDEEQRYACNPLFEGCSYWDDRIEVRVVEGAKTQSIPYFAPAQLWNDPERAYVALLTRWQEGSDMAELRVGVLDKETGDLQTLAVTYPAIGKRKEKGTSWTSIEVQVMGLSGQRAGDPQFLVYERLSAHSSCSTRVFLSWFVKEGENWKKYKIDEGGCVP